MATSTAPSDADRQPLPWWRGAALLDGLFKGLCRCAALSVIAMLLLLAVFLVAGAWPAIMRFGIGFLFSREWDPRAGSYGALNFVWGTLATSALAMLLAVPLGIAAATYLAEIAPRWVRRTGSFLVELLAAIPSVVYGFWGFFFLQPLFRVAFDWLDAPLHDFAQSTGMPWLYAANNTGRGLILAGVVLAIMILPYVTAITYDVCLAVPRSQREGSLALGSTRWQTIWRVVLPYARPGILGGCLLALGRALGETMAVIMLIGNNEQALSFSPLGQGASIASQIADKFMGSSVLQKSVLLELGLVLLLVTVAISSLARVLIWRSQTAGRTQGLWLAWMRRRTPSAAPVPEPAAQGP